jgi:hypothetical protein
MRGNLIIFLIVLFLGNILCSAQSNRTNSDPIGLILEVTYHKENKPAYLMVSENASRAKGGLFSTFQRAANWRQAAGSRPVSAVNIVSRLEGDAIRVNVSVIRGKEEFVAEYTMRENEKIVVRDLTKFGIEPFEIRAVGLTLGASDLPLIVNRSNSLTVERLEPVDSEIPSLKLILANNSEKAVSAFSYKVTVNGQLRLSGKPEGMDGKILIKPGEPFEAIIPNAHLGVKDSEGRTVSLEPNKTLTISAVVFEDGSFEGDDAEAARFLVIKFARKIQTKKIIALLEKTTETDSSLVELGRQAENLSVEVDENDFGKFINNFAALPDKEKDYLRSAINAVLKDVKSSFISDLEPLNPDQNKVESAEIRNRLKTNKEKYRNLLSHLN